MDATRVDRSGALRALGAAGAALFAALSHPAAPARARRGFATRVEISASSAPLPVTADSTVNATADCGGAGKVVSCGFQTSGSGAQLVNAFVLTVEPNTERSTCGAFLRRTAEAGSIAGATIQAVAICRVS